MCGNPRAARAAAIGRAIALVRHKTAISRRGVPRSTRPAAWTAMAVASVVPFGKLHSSTWGPGIAEASCLDRRSGLFAISADAAATMRRELLRFRPIVRVVVFGKLDMNLSRLARDAPRNR